MIADVACEGPRKPGGNGGGRNSARLTAMGHRWTGYEVRYRHETSLTGCICRRAPLSIAKPSGKGPRLESSTNSTMAIDGTGAKNWGKKTLASDSVSSGNSSSSLL